MSSPRNPERCRHRPSRALGTLLGLGLALLAAGCESDSADSGDPVSALVVVGFNVESGDAVAAVVADLMSTVRGESAWGLEEVQDDGWLRAFEEAAEAGEAVDFRRILGTTGGGDRLGLLYRADTLDLLDWYELHHINVGGGVRAPLVAHVRWRRTGQELLLMVNHLYRSRADRRHEQARLLNEWARGQTLPVIAIGDYNFDWAVTGGETNHDLGYDLMTADGVYRWIRPDLLLETQCSDQFDSVLDFTFAAGAALGWAASSQILAGESSYCPDNTQRSDHRPVLARFELPASAR